MNDNATKLAHVAFSVAKQLDEILADPFNRVIGDESTVTVDRVKLERFVKALRSRAADLGYNPAQPSLPLMEMAGGARARNTDKQTSHDAAARVHDISSARADVLAALLLFGPDNYDGVERRIRRVRAYKPPLRYSCRKRGAECLHMGWIEDSGRSRRMDSGREGAVWQLTELGRKVLYTYAMRMPAWRSGWPSLTAALHPQTYEESPPGSVRPGGLPHRVRQPD